MTVSVLKELMSDDESGWESESETEVDVATTIDVEDGSEYLAHTTMDQ